MISVVLPETDNLRDLELAYITYERVVFAEFMTSTREKVSQELGTSGLTDIHNRNDHHKLKKRLSNPADPLFLLGSLLDIFESPLREILPFNQRIRENALLVRQNRNLWAHFQPPELRNDILLAIRQLKQFCEDMELVSAADKGTSVFNRLSQISIERNRLINGQPVPTPTGATVVDASEAHKKPVSEIAIPLRPRVGGLWEHELPTTIFELNKRYGDVLDGNGESQSARLGDWFQETLRRWFSLGINSWLYVDDRDHATVALIGGDPYLVGYLGEEPNLAKGDFRGFFLPGTFVNVGGQLVDLDDHSQGMSAKYEIAELSADWIIDNVPEDSTVRITDHGDLVLIDEAGISCILTSSDGALPRKN